MAVARRLIRTALMLTVIVYSAIILLLVLLERHLIYPAPSVGTDYAANQDAGTEDVFFESADGNRLHGWLFAREDAAGALLYCHGNGEQVNFLEEELQSLASRLNVSVLAFDYRGYGKSEGTPYEAGVLSDGEAAQQWLANRTGQQPQDVLIYGRSLGGGVAAHLAAKNGARGVILDRTFSSIADVAASHYPWIPVKFLIRNRFDSTKRMSSVRSPVLQIHGKNDEVIPFAFAQKLFHSIASADKQFLAVDGLSHNGVHPLHVQQQIESFVARLTGN